MILVYYSITIVLSKHTVSSKIGFIIYKLIGNHKSLLTKFQCFRIMKNWRFSIEKLNNKKMIITEQNHLESKKSKQKFTKLSKVFIKET